MAETPVPITPGSGGASIASDLVGGNSYQQIKVVDGTIGSNNAWKINTDGSANVSIIGTITTTATQGASVSGTVGASIIGNVPTVVQGSVATVIIGGSIAATVTPTANQSVSGTVGASIIGNVPVVVQGSIAAVIIGGSIAASFTPAANQSVSGTTGASVIGTVPVVQSGIVITSIVSSTPSSVLVGASIFGALPAGNAILGAVAASISGLVNIAGSVVATQGTSPWVVNFQNSSIISINAGSVVAVSSGSIIAVLQSSSIIAIPTGNQSVSGSVGVTGTVTITGSVSAILAPYSASTQGMTSVMTGTTSVLVLAAAPALQRNYITHILVTNAAAVGTTVTIQDGASILWGGFAAASGGGWSENFNPPLPQPTSVKALYATSSVQASVFVAVNGFTGT